MINNKILLKKSSISPARCRWYWIWWTCHKFRRWAPLF